MKAQISGHTILELWKRSRPKVEPQECELVGGSGATVLVGHHVAKHFAWREDDEIEKRTYGEPRRVACDTCQARGWLPPTADWATKCKLCGGKGTISLHAIAEALDEDPGVFYRLSEQRVRPKTAARLLDKLLLLLNGDVSISSFIEANRTFNQKEVSHGQGSTG